VLNTIPVVINSHWKSKIISPKLSVGLNLKSDKIFYSTLQAQLPYHRKHSDFPLQRSPCYCCLRK